MKRDILKRIKKERKELLFFVVFLVLLGTLACYLYGFSKNYSLEETYSWQENAESKIEVDNSIYHLKAL
jgi:hypothetical protein